MNYVKKMLFNLDVLILVKFRNEFFSWDFLWFFDFNFSNDSILVCGIKFYVF